MKADKIIKNAKIFTADKSRPQATALAVKDGKFVYVGDEAGLSAYEGEVTDLGDIRIKKGLLAEQYKAVLPLLGYYQFMDKYFTPHYLLDIVAARG